MFMVAPSTTYSNYSRSTEVFLKLRVKEIHREHRCTQKIKVLILALS